MIPRFNITEKDFQKNTFPLEQLEVAVNNFSEKGCIIIENAFPKELIQELYNHYVEKYNDYFKEEADPNALKVGQKRIMISVELRPPFNTPLFYANPFVLPILEKLLGPDMILGSIGSVISLPGDPDQGKHRDNPGLFGMDIDGEVPSYIIDLFIPLIDFNSQNGTTRVWPTTHRNFVNGNQVKEYFDPEIKVGSCMLVDYRLYHAGTANLSQNLRPLIYNVYHRPWYRDYINYRNQPARIICKEEFEKIPERFHSLFSVALNI